MFTLLTRDKRDVRDKSDCLEVSMFHGFTVSMFGVRVFTSSNVHEFKVLFEPASTLNTRDERNKFTKEKPEHI
jgi:hypothetical protein